MASLPLIYPPSHFSLSYLPSSTSHLLSSLHLFFHSSVSSRSSLFPVPHSLIFLSLSFFFLYIFLIPLHLFLTFAFYFLLYISLSFFHFHPFPCFFLPLTLYSSLTPLPSLSSPFLHFKFILSILYLITHLSLTSPSLHILASFYPSPLTLFSPSSSLVFPLPPYVRVFLLAFTPSISLFPQDGQVSEVA